MHCEGADRLYENLHTPRTPHWAMLLSQYSRARPIMLFEGCSHKTNATVARLLIIAVKCS